MTSKTRVTMPLDNNYFGKELHKMLSSLKGSEERESYILMELIQPPAQPNMMLNGVNLTAQFCHMTSERGIYGIYVRY